LRSQHDDPLSNVPRQIRVIPRCAELRERRDGGHGAVEAGTYRASQGEIVIGRPVEEVFDYVADERSLKRLLEEQPPIG
jgi:hypothetical protein